MVINYVPRSRHDTDVIFGTDIPTGSPSVAMFNRRGLEEIVIACQYTIWLYLGISSDLNDLM